MKSSLPRKLNWFLFFLIRKENILHYIIEQWVARKIWTVFLSTTKSSCCTDAPRKKKIYSFVWNYKKWEEQKNLLVFCFFNFKIDPGAHTTWFSLISMMFCSLVTKWDFVFREKNKNEDSIILHRNKNWSDKLEIDIAESSLNESLLSYRYCWTLKVF